MWVVLSMEMKLLDLMQRIILLNIWSRMHQNLMFNIFWKMLRLSSLQWQMPWDILEMSVKNNYHESNNWRQENLASILIETFLIIKKAPQIAWTQLQLE